MKQDKWFELQTRIALRWELSPWLNRPQRWWRSLFQKAMSRFRSLYWTTKNHLKRHYHLHLMLKNQEKHWRLVSYFHAEDRRQREPKEVQGLFETLPRRLRILRNQMESASSDTMLVQRRFRGQFVKIVREHRRLSREQVCRLLNSHRYLSDMGNRHPSYWSEFPFTPAFIEKFEEDTAILFEEITQGFLFGAGFPTEDFARWLAEIYCAEKEFTQFKEWYAKLPLKYTGSF